MNNGAQAGIEFVVYVVGGAFAGWALDRWLGSSPWLLLLLFFIGTGCGFWRVFNIEKDLRGNDASPLQNRAKTDTNAPIISDDPSDDED